MDTETRNPLTGMRVLITCPPMLACAEEWRSEFDTRGVELVLPDVIQTLPEDALVELVPSCDGWIIGDDPVTRAVLRAGRDGVLKAAVRWGVGTDNIDFDAARELGFEIKNTPGMFGAEVADVAMAYVTCLARSIIDIDRGVRAGEWPKPRGKSLSALTMGIIGYGDIGKNLALRAVAAGMAVIAVDPTLEVGQDLGDVTRGEWPEAVGQCDVLVFTCALTNSNWHMLDAAVLALARDGVFVVNVARGPLIDEGALCSALISGRVGGAALDVMENEPLLATSKLRTLENCVFGTHNASNTWEAVGRTNRKAMTLLWAALEGNP